MSSGSIRLTTLIRLFAATTTAFAVNCFFIFCVPSVLAQTPSTQNPEAYRLIQQGNQQYQTNQPRAAIQSWEQALAIYEQIGDREGEGIALINLGHAYFSIGQYQKAIEFYQRLLAIKQELNNHIGEANSLNYLGEVYRNLGEYQKAIQFYQQSLTLVRQINHSSSDNHYDLLRSEANSLNNLSNVYRNLGQYQQAIAFGEQSLALIQEMSQLSNDNHYALLKETANLVTNLGHIYVYLNNYQQALTYYQQALKLAREIGDRKGEANSLVGLGNIYYSLEQYQRGIQMYQQALAIAREIDDRAGEGIILSNIGLMLAQQNQPELAIIFYKQSVNVREAIRHDIQGLPKEQQRSYLQTIAYTYRHLADMLLKQDRVLEAQRVLDLLKVQELEDFLQNIRGSNHTIQGVAERSPERQIKQGYEAILDKAIIQGKELVQLERIFLSQRTEAEQQRITELRKNQQEITQQFLQFLQSPEFTALIAQLRQTTGGQTFDLENNATSLQNNLKQIQQDAIVLYPFVLNDRLELVLVTPYAPPIRRTVAVKRAELNRVIAQFRSSLEKPASDAKTPAKQLYDWLIKPIENDLVQAKAKTIIYAPDGQLRYIPLAALYDGNQWLVEKYRINNITALSLTNFDAKPQETLQVFAAAFTQGRYSFQIGGQEFIFNGLQYAGTEVENLANIVPNTTKVLDQQFNQESIFQMNDYSVVHLATHAAFVIGQPEESFILFGDGSRANLRDVGSWRLPNVDLIVLSACETGLGSVEKKSGDGKEILGLGYQLQRTGTRAAIASLWAVDDGGTQVLMNAFYAALENGNTTKAEALRQAQIALITGNYQALGQQRGLAVVQRNSRGLPTAVNSRLSHPYYWAPFILIGNGL
jgi:CHAT domain-containing protein